VVDVQVEPPQVQFGELAMFPLVWRHGAILLHLPINLSQKSPLSQSTLPQLQLPVERAEPSTCEQGGNLLHRENIGKQNKPEFLEHIAETHMQLSICSLLLFSYSHCGPEKQRQSALYWFDPQSEPQLNSFTNFNTVLA
jgi:hypothetical protein